jgi:hypothetical protein
LVLILSLSKHGARTVFQQPAAQPETLNHELPRPLESLCYNVPAIRRAGLVAARREGEQASMLGLGAWPRIGVAAAVSALLWLAVAWALGWWD